jgi:hypothetical protein
MPNTARTLRYRSTPKASLSVAAYPNECRLPSPETRAVLEAVRACHAPTSWRKKDLLRGRQNYIASFFALLRDLKNHGSTPAQLEGVLVAFYNAGRRLVLSLLPLGKDALSEAIRKEQEVEGRENVAEIVALTTRTPGALRQLRAFYLESIEAQRYVVDIIDAELFALEATQ